MAPTAITAMPVPAAIAYRTSVATIPKHVTSGTNNVYDRYSSYCILEIIEMGIPPAATVALISLCDTIHHVLLWEQGSLQEEVAVAGSPNTVSATSDPSFLDLEKWTINELLRRL